MEGNRLATIDRTSQPLFEWAAHPAAERPGMTALACAIISLLGAAAWVSFGWIWAAGCVMVLVFSLNRYFFPSRFSLDDDGLTARYLLRTQRMRWRDVRRFTSDARGGYLSTRSIASRLDAYRGLHIIFGRHRQAAIERIKAMIEVQVDRDPRVTTFEAGPTMVAARVQAAGGRP